MSRTKAIEQEEPRQRRGDEPITVHGYAVKPSAEEVGTVHLYPRCSNVPSSHLFDLGTVTVRGTLICSSCAKDRVQEARGVPRPSWLLEY